MSITLSLCIATFNRSAFIGETIKSILSQLKNGVELVIVDGASTDDTARVIYDYQCEQLRYFKESLNSGVDRDYDKAVNYARGEFCWLMTDDDLVAPGGVERVVAALDSSIDLVIVNAEVRSKYLTESIRAQQHEIVADRVYTRAEYEKLFVECSSYLTFIGSVVIRRKKWLERDRGTYFGSLFIHYGVIFQSKELSAVKVLSTPCVVIRYGNATWTARAFEIWAFKWPELVWSFKIYSELAKRRVAERFPWKRAPFLMYYKAIGAFTHSSVELISRSPHLKKIDLIRARLIESMPQRVAIVICIVFLTFFHRENHTMKYDLVNSSSITKQLRWLAKVFWRADFSEK